MSRVPRASFGCGVAAGFRTPRSGTRLLDISDYRRLERRGLQAKRWSDLVRQQLFAEHRPSDLHSVPSRSCVASSPVERIASAITTTRARVHVTDARMQFLLVRQRHSLYCKFAAFAAPGSAGSAWPAIARVLLAVPAKTSRARPCKRPTVDEDACPCLCSMASVVRSKIHGYGVVATGCTAPARSCATATACCTRPTPSSTTPTRSCCGRGHRDRRAAVLGPRVPDPVVQSLVRSEHRGDAEVDRETEQMTAWWVALRDIPVARRSPTTTRSSPMSPSRAGAALRAAAADRR